MDKKFLVPKYDLEVYRQFIRDASPYVSVILGRKLKAQDADTLNNEELSEIAMKIDNRVDDLKAKRH